MNHHVLARSAIASKNAHLVVQALKNEDNLVWFEKLCAVSEGLSDQQKFNVLEEKLKKYADVRIIACTMQIKDPKMRTDFLSRFKKQYKTTLEPQQYEQILGKHIEYVLQHNIFPTEEKRQQEIWKQIDTKKVGSHQTQNVCFQNAINKIVWCPSVLQKITEQAIKGYHVYTFNELFTKSVSEEFFTKNFHAIDWEENISKEKFAEKYLWMNAISVLPLKFLTQLLDQHPSIAKDPLFVDKAALHPLHFKELLNLGFSQGMSLDLVRLRLDDTFFVDYQNSRQKGVDFLEEISTQQQKDLLFSHVSNQNVCSSKRKM